MHSFSLLAAVLPLTSAHFLLDYPMRRGFIDEEAPTFPCGGFDTAQSNRTQFPISGGPIQLDMHHTEAEVEVLLALGNDPGSAFNIILIPTFQERGPNSFCLSNVTFPTDLNITEGMNATIQVQTNGDPDGGLYQCADITFTSTSLSDAFVSAHCTNSSGVTAAAVSDTSIQPNGSTVGASASGSSASGSAAASATSSGLAAHQTLASWALGAVGVIGGLAAL